MRTQAWPAPQPLPAAFLFQFRGSKPPGQVSGPRARSEEHQSLWLLRPELPELTRGLSAPFTLIQHGAWKSVFIVNAQEWALN